MFFNVLLSVARKYFPPVTQTRREPRPASQCRCTVVHPEQVARHRPEHRLDLVVGHRLVRAQSGQHVGQRVAEVVPRVLGQRARHGVHAVKSGGTASTFLRAPSLSNALASAA